MSRQGASRWQVGGESCLWLPVRDKRLDLCSHSVKITGRAGFAIAFPEGGF